MSKIVQRFRVVVQVNLIMAAYLFFLKYSLKTKSFWCLGIDFKSKTTEYDVKWVGLATFLGFFFVIHAVMTTTTRLIAMKPVPYEGDEPKLISVFNRIMSNTLQQGIAFVSLLYVVSNVNPFDWSSKQFIHIVRLFIISRVVYSATYIASQITGMSGLRRYGFVGTLTANMCLLLAIIGVNIFQVISIIPLPK